jgi:hypothetical protein
MDAIRRLRAAWYPDGYHGWGMTHSYFEGWYFKLISADERHALAVIPGISMSAGGESHAFIQVMDGKKCTAEYHRYEASGFKPATQGFDLALGPNRFSGEQISLDLPGLQGAIRFVDPNPWPKMLGAPGIMGWYSFVPFMQCNHGVVSLYHTLEGSLNINGTSVDFTNGRGYIEKDWGRSFPKSYVWTQTNHFDTSDRVSLLASVAHIPWLGSHFIGFISGFWLNGRLFRFATYTGAKKTVELQPDAVTMIFKNPGTELRIRARQAPGTTLRSPISGEMTGKINESLQATMQVELLESGKRIFEGNGRNAGLEVAGPVEILTADGGG